MSAAAAAPAGSVLRWSSPIPYLFGGLALMLCLIALALIILACSYKHPFSAVSSSNNAVNGENQEKSSSSKYRRHFPPLEMEPMMVIVMPGEINPTYIATPTVPMAAVHSHHLEEV